VLWGTRGCLGCILCRERLKLSRKVEECFAPASKSSLDSSRHVASEVDRARTVYGCPMDMKKGTSPQGLTLVHLSAQSKRFVWDKGCLGFV